jgi:hypothetical protein
MKAKTVVHTKTLLSGVISGVTDAVVNGKKVKLYQVNWSKSLTEIPMQWRCEKNPSVRGYLESELTIGGSK